MSLSLEEQYPELFHYTGAQGLSGILQSQTLWATHYNYLNDAVEVRHFLDDRMPGVLHLVITELVQEFMAQSAANRTQVEQGGGGEKYVNQLIRTIITPMQVHLLDCKPGEEPLAEPHIVSFTAPEDDNIKAHGLLSQVGWARFFVPTRTSDKLHHHVTLPPRFHSKRQLFFHRSRLSSAADFM